MGILEQAAELQSQISESKSQIAEAKKQLSLEEQRIQEAQRQAQGIIIPRRSLEFQQKYVKTGKIPIGTVERYKARQQQSRIKAFGIVGAARGQYEEQKKKVAQAEEEILKQEAEINAAIQEEQDWIEAEKWAKKSVPTNWLPERLRSKVGKIREGYVGGSWEEQTKYIEQRAKAKKQFQSLISTMKASGEVPILSSTGEVIGVESATLGKSLSIGEYEKIQAKEYEKIQAKEYEKNAPKVTIFKKQVGETYTSKGEIVPITKIYVEEQPKVDWLKSKGKLETKGVSIFPTRNIREATKEEAQYFTGIEKAQLQLEETKKEKPSLLKTKIEKPISEYLEKSSGGLFIKTIGTPVYSFVKGNVKLIPPYTLTSIGVSLKEGKSLKESFLKLKSDKDIETAVIGDVLIGTQQFVPGLNLATDVYLGYKGTKEGIELIKTGRWKTPIGAGELTMAGLSTVPFIAKTSKFSKGQYYKLGAKYVPQEQVFAKEVLTGKETFPMSKSVKESIESFEKTRKGKYLYGSTSTTIIPKKISETVVGQKGRFGLEDPVIFITPKKEGSPYFLGLTKKTSKYKLSANIFKEITESFKTPSSMEIRFRKIRRYPKKVISKPGFKAVSEYLKSREGKGEAFITKRSEIGQGAVKRKFFKSELDFESPFEKGQTVIRNGRIIKVKKVLKGDILREAGTREKEAGIYAKLKRRKQSTLLGRLKGFEEYTLYEGEVIPLRKYSALEKLSKKKTSIIKIKKEDITARKEIEKYTEYTKSYAKREKGIYPRITSPSTIKQKYKEVSYTPSAKYKPTKYTKISYKPTRYEKVKYPQITSTGISYKPTRYEKVKYPIMPPITLLKYPPAPRIIPPKKPPITNIQLKPKKIIIKKKTKTSRTFKQIYTPSQAAEILGLRARVKPRKIAGGYFAGFRPRVVKY